VGGVGGAVTKIATRREFVEHLVVADYDAARAEKAVAALGDPRFVATQVDATDEAAVRALLTEHRCPAQDGPGLHDADPGRPRGGLTA
jgi:saccharopine dehydrogenase (NAD+, L-lysine forming)